MFKIIILSNLLLMLWGNAFLRLLWPQGRKELCIYLPLSYFLGECCVMLWMYGLAIFRVHFSILTIDLPISMMVLISCFFRAPLVEPEIQYPSGDEKWGMLKTSFAVIVMAYIAWQVFYVMWRSASIPVFEWDVVWRIGLKAKFFFFDQGIGHLKDMPYPGYALGGPFMMCWASLQTGRWCEEALRAIPAFEFLMFIILFFGSLKVLTSRFWALLGTGLLVSSGFFTYHASLLYNDFSVSVLFCSSVFCLLLWNKFNDTRLLWAASLLLGGAGLFKLEAFMYAFLIILTWRVIFNSKEQGLKALLIFLVPVTALLICHEALIGNLHVSSDGTSIGVLGMTGLMERMGMTVIALAKQFFVSWNWNVSWVFFFALLIAHFKRIRENKELRVLILFLGVLAAYLFLVSVLTDKFQVLGGADSYQTLPRMVLHFYPLCPAVIVFFLAME